MLVRAQYATCPSIRSAQCNCTHAVRCVVCTYVPTGTDESEGWGTGTPLRTRKDPLMGARKEIAAKAETDTDTETVTETEEDREAEDQFESVLFCQSKRSQDRQDRTG